METFTPYSALLGGAFIGLAATLLVALNGRIGGISGILAGMVPARGGEDGQWRLLFLAGLVAGAGLHRLVIAAPLPILIGGVRIPCLRSTSCCRPRATSTRG